VRLEVDELKQQLKKMQDSKREERKRLADDEAMRRIRSLDDSVHQLQKQVGPHAPHFTPLYRVFTGFHRRLLGFTAFDYLSTRFTIQFHRILPSFTGFH